MPKYIFAYHGGGKFETREEGMKHMELWRDWMKNKVGAAVADPGAPMGPSRLVTSSGVSDDGGPSPLSGYTLVMAESLEAAIDMAKSCPHLAFDSGAIEVAEALDMEM